MKILESKQLVSKENNFPMIYFCQVCNSKLELNEADYNGNVQAFSVSNKEEKFPAKGFVCPVCQSVNITG